MERTNRYDLTDDEVILLDGKCSKDVQREITRIKRTRSLVEAGVPLVLARVQANAERWGVLFTGTGRGFCERCGAGQTFRPVYIKGAKKGQPNPHKSLQYLWRGEIGEITFCESCYTWVFSQLNTLDFTTFENRIAKAEIAFPGEPSCTKMIRERYLKCPVCGGVSWEFDIIFKTSLSQKRTFFADWQGSKVSCPICEQAEDYIGGWKTIDFRLVPKEILTKESNMNLWVRSADVQALHVANILGEEHGPQA